MPRWTHRLFAIVEAVFACCFTVALVMTFVRGRALELKFGFLPMGLWMALWAAFWWWGAVATWCEGNGGTH
ncbi:MAG: hypothetical protein ACAH95_13345 [Fimbriimonas sp.]